MGCLSDFNLPLFFNFSNFHVLRFWTFFGVTQGPNMVAMTILLEEVEVTLAQM